MIFSVNETATGNWLRCTDLSSDLKNDIDLVTQGGSPRPQRA